MSTFTTETKINASVKDVWAVLADIGGIYRWNPGVQASHVTTKQTVGVGACRRCDLGGKNYLDEEVVKWEEDKFLTIRITDTNLPFKSADIHFTLQDQNGTTIVTVSPDYELKYGLLGRVLDTVYVNGTYKKGMGELLAGLKQHVESSKDI